MTEPRKPIDSNTFERDLKKFKWKLIDFGYEAKANGRMRERHHIIIRVSDCGERERERVLNLTVRESSSDWNTNVEDGAQLV